MANILVEQQSLQDIASAIRTKKGGSDTYTPSEMATAIGTIAGGIQEESSAANMDTHLASGSVGEAYKYTGTTTSTYKNGDIYVITDEDVPTTYHRVGGHIFYDHGDNGATYHLYDENMVEITGRTAMDLYSAYWYTRDADVTADRYYVYADNCVWTTPSSIKWGSYGADKGATDTSIGGGKKNTSKAYDSFYDLWAWLKTLNDNNTNGCNDWFIGNNNEQNQLRLSGLVDYYNKYCFWSSLEYSRYSAYEWWQPDNYWSSSDKSGGLGRKGIAFRAF